MAHAAKKWTIEKTFDGIPKLSDFKLVDEPVLFDLKPGEIVLEAVYLSVDPYMRLMAAPGTMMVGEQIARVKVSHDERYPEGTLVKAFVGWRTLTLVQNPDEPSMLGPLVSKIPDEMGNCPVSLALGCLGMTGLTAYFGMVDRGKVKAGEMVMVSGAAGAVGSVAGQIAKIKGCTVIGSAGSKEKCDWLTSLGFDHVFNYKEMSVDDALKKFVPQGIDVYFDNVGGDFTHTVLTNHMNRFGRAVICGGISTYNNSEKVPNTFLAVVFKQLDVLGIQVAYFQDRFAEGVAQLAEWIKEGKLKYRETMTEGFDDMPKAFIDLFSGGNTGKAVVRV